MKKTILILTMALAVIVLNAQIAPAKYAKIDRGYKKTTQKHVSSKVNYAPQEDELTFDYEPTEVKTVNYVGNLMTVTKLADVYEDGTIDAYSVFIENDDFFLDMYINTKVSSESALPLGTFPFGDEEAPNTADASVGGDDYYDYPTYIAWDFDDEGYYSQVYYIASGNVVVALDGTDTTVTINAKSHFGSTIKLTYKQNITTSVDFTESKNLQLISNNGILTLADVNEGEMIEVYSALGQKLYSQVVDAEQTDIYDLPRGQVLLVRVGSKIEKVIL